MAIMDYQLKLQASPQLSALFCKSCLDMVSVHNNETVTKTQVLLETNCLTMVLELPTTGLWAHL